MLTCYVTVTLNSQFRRQHPVWLALGLVQRDVEHSFNSGKTRAGIPVVISTSGEWSAVHSGVLGASGFIRVQPVPVFQCPPPFCMEKASGGCGGAAWKPPVGCERVWAFLAVPLAPCQHLPGPRGCVCPPSSGVTGHRGQPLWDPWAQGSDPTAVLPLCLFPASNCSCCFSASG